MIHGYPSLGQRRSFSRPDEWGAYLLPKERGAAIVEDVIKAFRCREPEKRIPVLRLELDYELALLYEALLENNTNRVDQCKTRLQELRQEMLQLEAL